MRSCKLSRHEKSKPLPPTEHTNQLPTIAEAIRETTSRLRRVGILPDESAIEARIMLQSACGFSQEKLLANSRDQLTETATSNLNRIAARRESREPLAYILGEKEFYGRTFRVDDRVLIPRPETEHLIDLCIEFVEQNPLHRPTICDIGTGSGIIAITLAKHIQTAKVFATDISTDAVEIAKTNSESHHADVEFRMDDATRPTDHGIFDMVVSNPPYIKTEKLDALQPEVRDWEPRSALDGGSDGMSVLQPLIRSLPRLLRDDGPSAAFIEIDPPVAAACLAIAQTALPDAEIEIHRDYAGFKRVLVVLRL